MDAPRSVAHNVLVTIALHLASIAFVLIKAPTKKERDEMQKTTARMVAAQPVSLSRPDHPKQFTLSGLLSR